MTVEEFNALVEAAYEAAFASEEALTTVYATAYLRQTEVSASTFETITAAWTPPIIETLSYGMSEEEIAEADRVRDEAAAAIVAVFAALGLAAVGREFSEAVSLRAQENFQQEIIRNLRKIVADGFNAGLSSAETAAIIREKLPQVIPASAEMLAQTELTSMVNQQALAAANKQFPDGILKTWLSVGDAVVRPAHAAVSGTSVPQDQPFNVGGFSMQYPGDLSAPLRLTARCRCRLSFTDVAPPTTIVASDWYERPDDWYETLEQVDAWYQTDVSRAADLAIVAGLNRLADKMIEMEQKDRMLASAVDTLVSPPVDLAAQQAQQDSVAALQQVAERLASAVEKIADKDTTVTVNLPDSPVPTVNVTLQAEPEKHITIDRDASGRIVGGTVEELPEYETEVVQEDV